MIPILTELLSPPVVGQDYMVPCVPFQGHVYPIMGRPHSDPLLGAAAAAWHWHIDQRFVTAEQLLSLRILSVDDIAPAQKPLPCGKQIILPNIAKESWNTTDFPNKEDVRLVRMTCLREMPNFFEYFAESSVYSGDNVMYFSEFEDQYEGTKLKGACKVCPHQGIPLASMKLANGKYLCPGHALRFNAETGEMERSTKSRAVANPESSNDAVEAA